MIKICNISANFPAIQPKFEWEIAVVYRVMVCSISKQLDTK